MIYAIQHHPLEHLGLLAQALTQRGESFLTLLAEQDQLPLVQPDDRVLLLGGPVNVSDAKQLAWLAREQKWLASVLANGNSVLAVCLGAQLLSHALGAAVSALPEAELGWQNITVNPAWSARFGSDNSGLWQAQQRPVLQWHQQQFALPEGALALGHSALCQHQGYLLERGQQRLLATQFHPEWNLAQLSSLLDLPSSSSAAYDDQASSSAAYDKLAPSSSAARDSTEQAPESALPDALAHTTEFAGQSALCHWLLDIWFAN